MEPQVRIGCNLDTCQRDPTPIKLMGYEHREDEVGGGGAGNVKHKNTHTNTHTVSYVIHRVDGASSKGRTQS